MADLLLVVSLLGILVAYDNRVELCVFASDSRVCASMRVFYMTKSTSAGWLTSPPFFNPLFLRVNTTPFTCRISTSLFCVSLVPVCLLRPRAWSLLRCATTVTQANSSGLRPDFAIKSSIGRRARPYLNTLAGIRQRYEERGAGSGRLERHGINSNISYPKGRLRTIQRKTSLVNT